MKHRHRHCLTQWSTDIDTVWPNEAQTSTLSDQMKYRHRHCLTKWSIDIDTVWHNEAQTSTLSDTMKHRYRRHAGRKRRRKERKKGRLNHKGRTPHSLKRIKIFSCYCFVQMKISGAGRGCLTVKSVTKTGFRALREQKPGDASGMK